jgi:hypothetical protein
MKAAMIPKFLFVIIPIIIAARFPFLQNFTVTSYNYDGRYLIVTGTVDVALTEKAWTEFGYKGGNFYYFNEWWQNQAGNKFGPFQLVSITWTLLEHTNTYDKLAFELVLTFHK